MTEESEAFGLLESDYLCSHCHRLLYIELKSREEYCLTPKCQNYPPFQLATNTAPVKSDLSEKKSKLLSKIKNRFNHENLVDYLFWRRIELLKQFYSGKPLNTDLFFTLGEMLIELNSHKCFGRSKSKGSIDKIVNDYVKLIDYLNFVEDTENQRVILTKIGKVLTLKYWHVFLNQWENYGLVSSGKIGSKDLFKFESIDMKKSPRVKIERDMEFSDFFKSHYTHSIALRYMLGKYYRTKEQYDYQTSNVDIAALLGLQYSLKKEQEIWSKQGLKSHLDKTSQDKRDFEDFSREYIDGNKVPIIVKLKNNAYLLDWITLMFFLFHLVGCYALSPKPEEKDAKRILSEPKELASEVFEDEIREILREREWSTTNEEFKLRKASPAYDVIAVNEDGDEIFLIEAKYHDISPSSISGKTLIQQVLFSSCDDNLITISKKHSKRMDFFKNNFHDFKEKLSILKNADDKAKITVIVVTKWTPLIHEYGNVMLLDFDEFSDMC